MHDLGNLYKTKQKQRRILIFENIASVQIYSLTMTVRKDIAGIMVFTATFNNISWQSVLLVD
jgi:hypothetical protein